MPKTKSLADKEKDLKEFIKLTWEAVCLNQEYRANYVKFTESNPGGIRKSKFDGNLRRYVWDDEEASDPERCNLSYMMQRWGFACDPDKLHPCGSYWLGGLLSKKVLKQRKEGGPIFLNAPLILDQTELRRLPGVLEVKKWPDSKLTEESILKQQEALRLVKDGWRPQTHQESQEFKDLTRDQWEIDDPPCLTISINLKAPSHLIMYALEFLIAICKAELGISDGKIDCDTIRRYLKAWKLKHDRVSDEQISHKIPIRKYELKEEQRSAPEMVGADHEIDSDTDYNIKRIQKYIEKAEEMIQRGSVI